MAQIEAIIEPDSIGNYVGRESVAFVSIHAGIVSQTKLIWQYLGPRIGLPTGWHYRVRELDEDLLVEDFQGNATVVSDALQNTYQRAETLEGQGDKRAFVELFNPDTRESWSALLEEQTTEGLKLEALWQNSDHVPLADKSVYSQSPDASLDGRFDQMALAANTFNHSASNLCEPELHSSGLVVINQSRRYQELTHNAGRAVPYITNHLGEHFVLVSHAPGSEDFHDNLPPDWSHGEVELKVDWRVVLERVIKTVEIVDGSKTYHGPVLLPDQAPPEPADGTFTHKMIKKTDDNNFSQLAYECPSCTFEQLKSIDPPPGWSRGPTQVLLAQAGELRSTPCGVPSSVDFLAEMPGNEYQLIAKPLGGELLEVSSQGIMVINQVQRDTLLRFSAGNRVHELTSPEGDIYVLFAYGVDSMDEPVPDFNRTDILDGYPTPTGWTYSSRVLERGLVLDSAGVVSVLAIRGDAPSSTWEKR